MFHIITYDLCSPGKNYSELIDAIKSYSKCSKVTESTWVISSNDSCKTIRDTLATYIDSNDRIFVGKLTGEAAWHNAICGANNLKTNLQLGK